MMVGRQLWVVLHRWAGLSIALFLVVAGLTGSVLVWHEELHRLTAPMVRAAPLAPGAAMIDPLVLRERAEALSGGRIDHTRLDQYPDRTMAFYPKPREGEGPLGFEEIRLDPYSGAEAGRRTPGQLGEGLHNLIPFVYDLHYQFALGTVGTWVFGIAALIWTIDCFVGFYLTLPARQPGRLRRWWKSWRVGWPPRGAYRLNADLHRAGGLWLWPLLFVFAWSAVGFNLPRTYDAAMTAIIGPRSGTTASPALARPLDRPRMTWAEARQQGRALAAIMGKHEGFAPLADMALGLDRTTGIWTYRFRSTREVFDKYGQSSVRFRDADGSFVELALPSGQSARRTVDSWLVGLHIAYVGGFAYRLFVTILGLAITMLTVTGVIIWMRKRSARILSRSRAVTRLTPQPAE